ncbi:MAG: ThiF family adenylyltransferase [Candidatus Thorarchaeota archaeon]
MNKKIDPPDIGVERIESIDSDKYDRQKRIKGWDQDKIINSKVLVIGAGATGNEVIKNLVLAGVGTITLIDYDFINLSNLNRCILFTSKSANENQYKADVIKQVCQNLNPEVKINTVIKDLNQVDKDIFKKNDVICSCLDNVEARLEANNYSYFFGIPFIDSGIDGYFGTVQAVYSEVETSACLQCGISNKDLDIMWQKFSCTGEELNAENGETVPKIASIITTTSIIGGIQAQQVLKFILGVEHFKGYGRWDPKIGEPLIGKQLNYNGLNNTFKVIQKAKDPKCWTCSYSKQKIKD